MLEHENILGANNNAEAVGGAFRGTPTPRGQPASGNGAYDDSAAARIENRHRLEAAAVDERIRRAGLVCSVLQNFQNSAAALLDKQKQMGQLVDEAHGGTYTPSRMMRFEKELGEIGSQVNQMIDSVEFEGNRIFSSEGRNMSISITSDFTVALPAKNLSVDVGGLSLAEGTKSLADKIRYQVEVTTAYEECLQHQKERVKDFANALNFELDILQDGMDGSQIELQAALPSPAHVLKDQYGAIQSQAHADAAVAARLLEDT